MFKPHRKRPYQAKEKTVSIHSNKFSKTNEHQSRSCSWKLVEIKSRSQKHKHPHRVWCVVLSEGTKDCEAVSLAILVHLPESFVRLRSRLVVCCQRQWNKGICVKRAQQILVFLRSLFVPPLVLPYNNAPYNPIKPNSSFYLVCVWKYYKERKLAPCYYSSRALQSKQALARKIQNKAPQFCLVAFNVGDWWLWSWGRAVPSFVLFDSAKDNALVIIFHIQTTRQGG